MSEASTTDAPPTSSVPPLLDGTQPLGVVTLDPNTVGEATTFVPPTAADVAEGPHFEDEPGNSEPPRQTAASRMKQKVRDVLDAQPFHGGHIHKSDLIAVIDALIDGPDSDGPGY